MSPLTIVLYSILAWIIVSILGGVVWGLVFKKKIGPKSNPGFCPYCGKGLEVIEAGRFYCPACSYYERCR